MKKVFALVLALAMIMMVGAVYAEGGAATTPALPKATIKIINMEKGDVVSLYKIIKWDRTIDAAKGLPDWAFDGITVTGYPTVKDLKTALEGTNAPAAMTALAAAVASKDKETADVTIDTDGTYTYEAEVGSYLALVVGANGNIYNPMVLSVNFDYSKQPAEASQGALDADTALTGDTIVAKKQPVTLEKEVKGTDKKSDVAVGDTIPFIVRTVTPNYGTNYDNPKFEIKDVLSDKIEMTAEQQAAITVKYDDKDDNDENDVALVKDTDYTITTSASGYEIKFTKVYLNKVKANTAIKVEYTATVNEKAEMHNVEQYDNDVDITYSNSPTTNDGHDHKETHHYTFSIDASLLGSTGGDEVTKELVKIGVDAETGEVITSWKTGDTTKWSEITPLKGAHFTLVGNGHTYEADSDENGYLNFTGLDVGDYTLTETSAPDGYKFSKAGIPVKISALYNTDGTLQSYEIKVNNKYTSSYTTTNVGEWTTKTTVDDNVDTTGIINEKGVTLPSTGGIGTTIFYILGGLLVVGAAVILVARRKAQD